MYTKMATTINKMPVNSIVLHSLQPQQGKPLITVTVTQRRDDDCSGLLSLQQCEFTQWPPILPEFEKGSILIHLIKKKKKKGESKNFKHIASVFPGNKWGYLR